MEWLSVETQTTAVALPAKEIDRQTMAVDQQRQKMTSKNNKYSINILFFIVSFFFFSCEKPATEEKIKDILQNEIHKKDFLKDYNMKISLLEFINSHKIEILDSLIKQNYKSECNDLGFSKYRMPPNLPRGIFSKCSSFASEDILNSFYLIVCKNQPFILRQSETDFKNYLDIHYIIFKSNDSVMYHKHKYYKEIIINKKYHFGVEIIDAFNSIDPNNFAPN